MSNILNAMEKIREEETTKKELLRLLAEILDDNLKCCNELPESERSFLVKDEKIAGLKHIREVAGKLGLSVEAVPQIGYTSFTLVNPRAGNEVLELWNAYMCDLPKARKVKEDEVITKCKRVEKALEKGQYDELSSGQITLATVGEAMSKEDAMSFFVNSLITKYFKERNFTFLRVTEKGFCFVL